MIRLDEQKVREAIAQYEREDHDETLAITLLVAATIAIQSGYKRSHLNRWIYDAWTLAMARLGKRAGDISKALQKEKQRKWDEAINPAIVPGDDGGTHGHEKGR